MEKRKRKKQSKQIHTCKVVGKKREQQRLQVEEEKNSAKKPYGGY